MDIVQTTLDGLAVGAAYGLLALGFTLVFGVMRRLNLAFGASVLVGIFAGAWAHGTGWGLGAVLLATLGGSLAATAYVERVAFAAVGRDAALASMVSSFALWMQLEEGVARAFPQRSYAFPTFGDLPRLTLGPLSLRPEHAATLAVALLVAAALHLALRRTRFGLALRCLSDSPEAARVSGVDVARTTVLAFALAALVGGIAGFLIAATDGQVTPKLGLWATLKGLIAMVIGGMGSLRGALVGGLVLGVVEAQAQWFLGAQGREIAVYALLFAGVVLLPAGLMGGGRAAARAEAAGRL